MEGVCIGDVYGMCLGCVWGERKQSRNGEDAPKASAGGAVLMSFNTKGHMLSRHAPLDESASIAPARDMPSSAMGVLSWYSCLSRRRPIKYTNSLEMSPGSSPLLAASLQHKYS
jgi:hypothetical protein